MTGYRGEALSVEPRALGLDGWSGPADPLAVMRFRRAADPRPRKAEVKRGARSAGPDIPVHMSISCPKRLVFAWYL